MMDDSSAETLGPGAKLTKKRKKTARDRAMKKAVREANMRPRTKKGVLRKGKTMSDVMRLANKLADRMMR